MDLPDAFDSASIVDNYDLSFDANDRLNGSLYVCSPRGAGPQAAAGPLAALKEAGLFSAGPEKTVPDEQRQAYKDGLEFVEARAYASGDGHFVIARFDHPKFPSDAGRWQAWVALFEGLHERLG